MLFLFIEIQLLKCRAAWDRLGSEATQSVFCHHATISKLPEFQERSDSRIQSPIGKSSRNKDLSASLRGHSFLICLLQRRAEEQGVPILPEPSDPRKQKRREKDMATLSFFPVRWLLTDSPCITQKKSEMTVKPSPIRQANPLPKGRGQEKLWEAEACTWEEESAKVSHCEDIWGVGGAIRFLPKQTPRLTSWRCSSSMKHPGDVYKDAGIPKVLETDCAHGYVSPMTSGPVCPRISHSGDEKEILSPVLDSQQSPGESEGYEQRRSGRHRTQRAETHASWSYHNVFLCKPTFPPRAWVPTVDSLLRQRPCSLRAMESQGPHRTQAPPFINAQTAAQQTCGAQELV